MSSEVLLAVVLGVIATYVTGFLKKYMPDADARMIQLAVFATCLVTAVAVTLVRKYAPAELLGTISVSFTTAVAYYEVAVKKHE